MNVHDSEKIANLLHHARLAPRAAEPDDADLLVVNTCSIREKAEHRLYSDLGLLRAWKARRPGRVRRGRRLRRAAGGRRAAAPLPAGRLRLRHAQPAPRPGHGRARPSAGARRARHRRAARLERFDLPERHPDFAATTPGPRLRHGDGGLRHVLRFCVVPRTRGREISRPAAAIVREARGARRRAASRGHAARPDRERLRPPRRAPRPRRRERARCPSRRCSRRLAAIPGLARIRYTSPHPIFFDDALIARPRRARDALPARPPAAPERLGRRARAHAPPLRRATTYRRARRARCAPRARTSRSRPT